MVQKVFQVIEKEEKRAGERDRRKERGTTKLYVQKYCYVCLIFLSEHQEKAKVLQALYYNWFHLITSRKIIQQCV